MVSDLSTWTALISQQQEETARAQREENEQLERVSSPFVDGPYPTPRDLPEGQHALVPPASPTDHHERLPDYL
jgi:hypothetical protein